MNLGLQFLVVLIQLRIWGSGIELEILTPTVLRAPDNSELIGGYVPESVQVKEEKNMQESGSGWVCQGERYGKQRQRDKRAEW